MRKSGGNVNVMQIKLLLDLAALIMFARLGENQRLTTKGEMPTRPTLLFDYARDGGCYTAADKHWRADISSALFNLNAEGESHLGTCALSGEQDVALVADTFPEAKCEHLGTVKIFSRKKETPTLSALRQKSGGKHGGLGKAGPMIWPVRCIT